MHNRDQIVYSQQEYDTLKIVEYNRVIQLVTIDRKSKILKAKLLDQILKQAMDDLLKGKITAQQGDAIADQVGTQMAQLETQIQWLEDGINFLEKEGFRIKSSRKLH